MKYSFLSSSFFVFSCILFFSCGEKQICTESEDLGSVNSSDTLLSFFKPIMNQKIIFFKDSLGNELKFNGKTDNYKHTIKNSFSEYKDCPSGEFTIRTEETYITLTAFIPAIEISFFSGMSLTGPNYSKEYREEMRFHLHKPTVLQGLLYFNDIVFENTKNSVPVTLKHTNITLFGKEYKDVIIDKKITPTMCYLDKKVGIRAFRDFDNKLWVFDRFE